MFALCLFGLLLIRKSVHFMEARTQNCISFVMKEPSSKHGPYTGCFRRNSKYYRRRYYGLFRLNKFI